MKYHKELNILLVLGQEELPCLWMPLLTCKSFSFSVLSFNNLLLEFPVLPAHGALMLGLLSSKPLHDAMDVEAMTALTPHLGNWYPTMSKYGRAAAQDQDIVYYVIQSNAQFATNQRAVVSCKFTIWAASIKSHPVEKIQNRDVICHNHLQMPQVSSFASHFQTATPDHDLWDIWWPRCYIFLDCTDLIFWVFNKGKWSREQNYLHLMDTLRLVLLPPSKASTGLLFSSSPSLSTSIRTPNLSGLLWN